MPAKQSAPSRFRCRTSRASTASTFARSCDQVGDFEYVGIQEFRNPRNSRMDSLAYSGFLNSWILPPATDGGKNVRIETPLEGSDSGRAAKGGALPASQRACRGGEHLSGHPADRAGKPGGVDHSPSGLDGPVPRRGGGCCGSRAGSAFMSERGIRAGLLFRDYLRTASQGAAWPSYARLSGQRL